jgi:hypothetical protein
VDLPFALETDLERRLAADPRWRLGVEWGVPRRGHPEGAVKLHIGEVLANLDLLDLVEDQRTRLRIAALAHDAFKREVRWWRPRVPPNEHGFIAARWLRGFVGDERLLALVELHDEGFRAWKAGEAGRGDEAASRVAEVVRRLGDDMALFVDFYWADNRSGDKRPGQVEWFIDRLARLGLSVKVPPIA